MAQGQRTTDDELQQMLDMWAAGKKKGLAHGEIYEQIGLAMGRSSQAVQMVLLRLRPTTALALVKVKSKAAKMMERVIRKGTTSELIDVLSRSNVGVLAPKTESGVGGGGFFLSVSAESCGAVKVGVAIGGPPRMELPESVEEAGASGYLGPAQEGIIEIAPEPEKPPRRFFTAAVASRERLKKAREEAQRSLQTSSDS